MAGRELTEVRKFGMMNLIRELITVTRDTNHESRIMHYASCILHHGPRLATLLLLFFFPLLSSAQDVPATGTVLPFQQDAVTADNEDQLAMQFFQARNFEKAAELYSHIYPKKPSYFNYTYYFFCLVELRQYDDARKLIKTQQKTEPNSIKYQVDLGYVYFREGNAEKSEKTYEDALKKLPPEPGQVYELANAFYSKGEFEFVIRTYLKGRQMLPENYTFGFELAGVYERTGNFEGAFGEYLYMLGVNKSFESTVRDRLQMLLANDDDNSKNELFRKMVLTRIQKDPEKTYYSELLLWYSVQLKDFELALAQARALDRRLKENGSRIMELAALAISNGNYEAGEDAYKYIISRGESCQYYEAARRELLHTRYLRLTSGPPAAKKEYTELQKSLSAEMVKWENDPEAVRIAIDLAHLETFYLDRPDEALDLLDRVIAWRGLPDQQIASAKMELADIHVYRGDLWTATVAYQQVYRDFKNDATGQEAKFRNARLSYYMGEFDWAKAQLDILKAATTKFISNDAMELSMLISNNYDPDSNTIALGIYSRAELADFRNREDLALATLDSIPAMFKEHPILDNVNYRKGEIYFKQGKYAMADSMFAIVTRDRPQDIITDEALMNRAVIHETWLADKQGAMEFYQELLNDFPGSIFVPEARKKYRSLRGDSIK